MGDKQSQIYWAAFFGDCDHSVNRVFGNRITLAYILRKTTSIEESEGAREGRLAALKGKQEAMPPVIFFFKDFSKCYFRKALH